MKQIINEKTIRQIVRESLINLLEENERWYDDDYELTSDEKWDDVENEFWQERGDDPEDEREMDMWLWQGNHNRKDMKGIASMAAQGHPDALTTRIARNGKIFNSLNHDKITQDELDAMSNGIDDDISREESNYLRDRMIKEAINNVLKKYLGESKDDEMADMYDKHGNNNVHDTKGRESMWAQGKEGETATHIGRATRSTGADSVKAAKNDKYFKKKFNK